MHRLVDKVATEDADLNHYATEIGENYDLARHVDAVSICWASTLG